MSEGFLKRRLVRPIIELLRQGVTPDKLALSLALGVALGIFPALGWTTALCAIAALVLRLNLPAIQIVNYFMYPAADRAVTPFLPSGRVAVSRAASGNFRVADLRHDSREHVERDTSFVDHHLARHRRMVLWLLR